MSGCATKVWYQSGKTQVEIQKDWAESQLAAKQAALKIKQPVVLTDDGFAAGLAMRAQMDARDAAKEIAPLTMQAKGY